MDGLLGLFGLTKTYSREVTDYDRTEQENWEKNQRNLLNDYTRKKLAIENDISRVEGEKNSCEADIRLCETSLRRIDSKIRDIDESIKINKELYDDAVKYNQTAYTEKMKAELKEHMKQVLLGEDDETSGSGIQSAVSALDGFIDATFDDTLAEIREKATEEYRSSVDERIAEYEIMIGENKEELEKRFKNNTEDINSVTSVCNDLREYFGINNGEEDVL